MKALIITIAVGILTFVGIRMHANMADADAKQRALSQIKHFLIQRDVMQFTEAEDGIAGAPSNHAFYMYDYKTNKQTITTGVLEVLQGVTTELNERGIRYSVDKVIPELPEQSVEFTISYRGWPMIPQFFGFELK